MEKAKKSILDLDFSSYINNNNGENHNNFSKKKRYSPINNVVPNVNKSELESTSKKYNQNEDDIEINFNYNDHFFDLPWDKASNNPELIKPGTEIKVYPIPVKIDNDSNVTNSTLYNTFKQYGEIINIEIDSSNRTAYIRFINEDSVNNLLKLRHIKIKNNFLRISESNENLTIFLGNIKKIWSLEYIKNLFEKISIHSYIKQIRILNDPNNKHNLNRGYAFLEFENSIFARKVYNYLSNNLVLDNQCITVDWAKGYSNDNNDINKFQIYVNGITYENKSEDLFKLFSFFGKIICIKLSRDKNNSNNNSNRTDYGFITYHDEESAKNAIDNFDKVIQMDEFKNLFKNKLTISYAKKISSIMKHREEVYENYINKKRLRDDFKKKKTSKHSFDINLNSITD